MFFAFTLSSSLGASLLFFYPARSMTSAKKQNSPFLLCTPLVSLQVLVCKGFVLPLNSQPSQNPTNLHVWSFASAEKPTQNAHTNAATSLRANASTEQPTQFARSLPLQRPLLHVRGVRKVLFSLDLITFQDIYISVDTFRSRLFFPCSLR